MLEDISAGADASSMVLHCLLGAKKSGKLPFGGVLALSPIQGLDVAIMERKLPDVILADG